MDKVEELTKRLILMGDVATSMTQLFHDDGARQAALTLIGQLLDLGDLDD